MLQERSSNFISDFIVKIEVINNMQDLYRIDLAQIVNKQADEQHPITLHYGHHYFTNAISKDNYQHRRQPTDATSESAVILDPIKHKKESKEPAYRRDGSFKINKELSCGKKEGSASKILSLKEIKCIEKKQKILSHTLIENESADMSRDSGRGDLQNLNSTRSNFIELGGRPARGKSNKKISLVKYLEFRSTQLTRKLQE